jgi:predicted nucleotidyltransferase
MADREPLRSSTMRYSPASATADSGRSRRTSASSSPDCERRRMLRRSAEGATRVTLDEITVLRLAELCQKYGIAELSVFGSVARGDARPDSDVDLLYVRVPGNDLGMSYFALQDDLEKLFGRPVDLVPKEGLHRVIRDQVLADAQVLYAA